MRLSIVNTEWEQQQFEHWAALALVHTQACYLKGDP